MGAKTSFLLAILGSYNEQPIEERYEDEPVFLKIGRQVFLFSGIRNEVFKG